MQENVREGVWHYVKKERKRMPRLHGSKVNGGTSVVFSLLEGEMSRIWYQNDQ